MPVKALRWLVLGIVAVEGLVTLALLASAVLVRGDAAGNAFSDAAAALALILFAVFAVPAGLLAFKGKGLPGALVLSLTPILAVSGLYML